MLPQTKPNPQLKSLSLFISTEWHIDLTAGFVIVVDYESLNIKMRQYEHDFDLHVDSLKYGDG